MTKSQKWAANLQASGTARNGGNRRVSTRIKDADLRENGEISRKHEVGGRLLRWIEHVRLKCSQGTKCA